MESYSLSLLVEAEGLIIRVEVKKLIIRVRAGISRKYIY